MVNFFQKLASFGSSPFREEETETPTQQLEKAGVDVDDINKQVDTEIEQVSANTLSKQEVTEIIRNAPEGTAPNEVISGLLDRGFVLDGLSPEGEQQIKQQFAPAEEVEDEFEIPKIAEDIEEEPGVITDPFENLLEGLKLGKEGVRQTIFNALDSGKQVFEGLASAGEREIVLPLANKIRTTLGKPELTDEEAKKIQGPVNALEKTIQEDLLDVGQGSLNLGITATFPVATTAFTTAGETELGEDVLQGIAGFIQTGGEFINKITGLSDFRESLPADRRADFDAFVGQSVTLGLFKASSKFSEIRASWAKANEAARTTQTAGEILRPTPKEIKLGVADSAERGIQKIAKETGKDVKDFKALKESIPEIKEGVFKPLKDGLDDAQNNLFKKEKTGLTKNESVTSSLDQLQDVLKDTTAQKFKVDKARVDFLIKKDQGKGLTLNELQEVKTLHTTHNRLFTEKGEVRGKTVTSDDLQGLRSDIKTLIEERAELGGFKDVKEVNARFGDVVNAEILVKERLAEVSAKGFKIEQPGVIGKAIGLLLDVKLVNTLVTKPGQAIFSKFSKGAVERNVSITELQVKLPKLLKELRDAGEPPSSISKFLSEIKKSFPAITIDNNE